MLRFTLRWRFDYSNGRPSAYGEWNDTSEGKAALVTKDNLRRAAIEAYDPAACAGVIVAAECDGWDFVNFAWVSIVSLACPENRVIGLSLTTREEIFEVYFSGSGSRRQRTADEKKLQFAGFGR